jgi:uncharacterized membrane protein YhhN
VFSPEIGRAAFRWAVFIVVVAVGLLVTLRPGTPEFAITVVTLTIGLVFIAVIALLIRLSRP